MLFICKSKCALTGVGSTSPVLSHAVFPQLVCLCGGLLWLVLFVCLFALSFFSFLFIPLTETATENLFFLQMHSMCPCWRRRCLCFWYLLPEIRQTAVVFCLFECFSSTYWTAVKLIRFQKDLVWFITAVSNYSLIVAICETDHKHA